MNYVLFEKYHGNGNDFLIIDSRGNSYFDDFINKKSFKIDALCNRNFGIGADGLIFILNSDNKDNDAKMIIYNSDNTEAQMCGNGIRCLVQYLSEKDIHKKSYKIETKAGVKIAFLENENISVKMGKPILTNNKIPTTLNRKTNGLYYMNFTDIGLDEIGYAVGMGNPHLIFFIERLSNINHLLLGPILEKNSYFPEKTNVHFCEIISDNDIKVLVWERGAGPTLACGTGACAIHVAAYKLGLINNNSRIILPGGNLFINWSKESDEVVMTGKASKVFEGKYYIK